MGLDIGGSGVKAAVVDLDRGELVSDRVRLKTPRPATRRNWSWKRWARSVDRYLARLEYLLGVDQFVIGGGASKKGHKLLARLEEVGREVVVARMGNLAGIIGAALLVGEEYA